jgi:POT family proton-dependent oligopeptide transporter
VTATETSSDLFGHPRGLSVLFATETWERFSYFGNSALVVLYMVQHLLQPGRIEGVMAAAQSRPSPDSCSVRSRRPSPRSCSASTGLAYSAPYRRLVADRIWASAARS